jgi:uncharacterized protein (TIGR03067 family)
MKLLTSVCGVIVALAVVGTATGQEGEKRTIKRLAWFLIDAKTKGVSEQTETKGTGIKQIEISEGIVAKKVLLEAKDTNGDQISEYLGDLGREWVVKSVKLTLADDTVVEAQILLAKETGKATLQNVKKAGPRVVSDKGTRTWNAFYAENQVATDSSKEDIAQAEKDMEALQGTWRESKMTTVVVKGDRLSQIDFSAGPRDVITGLITIDAKTKAIDWPMETGLGGGVTMRGIYELKGDNLRIIFGEPRRPKTFDEDGWLLVLKREKP